MKFSMPCYSELQNRRPLVWLVPSLLCISSHSYSTLRNLPTEQTLKDLCQNSQLLWSSACSFRGCWRLESELHFKKEVVLVWEQLPSPTPPLAARQTWSFSIGFLLTSGEVIRERLPSTSRHFPLGGGSQSRINFQGRMQFSACSLLWVTLQGSSLPSRNAVHSQDFISNSGQKTPTLTSRNRKW